MKHLYLFLLTVVSTYSFGQQSVNSAGGDIISSAQGSVAFSIGQVSTNWIESGAIINEGVQQPYEIFNVLSIDHLNGTAFLEIYPNPTTGIVYLKSTENSDADIEIYDESGRLVFQEQQHKILQSKLDLTSFSRGVYSIKVSTDSSVQLIKIIKN